MRFTNKIAVTLIMLVLLVGTQVGMAQTELTWFFCCHQSERNEMFNRWAREFESLNPGVTVNVMWPSDMNYYDKISVSIAGDMAPDIFWLGNTLWNYVDLAMPLNDLYKSEPMINEITSTMIQAHLWKGNLIAIPYGVNAHVFFYNKDLFGTVGISMPKDWTWTEAIAMGKKLTLDIDGDGKIDRWGLSFSDTNRHAITYGGNVYSEDLRKVMIDNPVTIAGVQLTADLVTGKSNAYYTAGHHTAAYAEFINGKLGAPALGVFATPGVRSDAKFDWDITMFPRLEVDKKFYRTSYFSPEAWMIYKGTKHPDLAKKLLVFIMQKEKMGEFAQQGAIIPTQPSVAVRWFLNVDKPANMRAFTDTLSYFKNSEQQHPVGIQQGMFPIWNEILTGKKPAAIGIPEMARQMQVRVDEYWAKHN